MFRILILVLLSFVASATGHLCIISPGQRGGFYDVHSPGSNACFRQVAPCGGMAPLNDGPYETWQGGQQTFVKWQQNFNHYEIGYPGYMDISIAPINSSDWQTLAFTPDVYVYAQDYLRNYTTFVVIPNIDCPHCVLRARYASHKPGEGTFYQCADITIKYMPPETRDMVFRPNPKNLKHKEYKTAMQKFKSFHQSDQDMSSSSELSLRGFGYSPLQEDATYLVNVTFDGMVKAFSKFSFGVDFKVKYKSRLDAKLSVGRRELLEQSARKGQDPAHMMFILDSVTTINLQNNIVTLYHDDGYMDVPAGKLVEFDSQYGTMLYSSEINNLNGIPVSAIMAAEAGVYYTFSVVPNAVADNGYDFIVGKVSPKNGTLFITYEKVFQTEPEPLYVNFQWAEIDIEKKLIYVLMGNENSPARLKARIYTFDIGQRKLSHMAELDVSQYGFMDIRLYKKTGKLYTLSPGLYLLSSYYPAPKCDFTLLEIDPSTGTVTPVFTLSKPGDFTCYYGGAVFNGIDQSKGILYHVLHMPDTGSDVIAMVDIENESATFSQFTNLRFVHNLALTRNTF